MENMPAATEANASLDKRRNGTRRLPRPRFPIRQSFKIGRYIAAKRLRRVTRFPLVLMLEPLHRCNLSCAGCGRIREYRDHLGDELSLEECLASAEECGAPVVSVCGGEPLIYRDIVPLTDGLVRQGRYVYLCTNGWKLADMAPRLTPSPRLVINVHLDGCRELHEKVVCQQGLFDRVMSGIARARERGFRVTTNTTFYAATTIEELERLFTALRPYGVEGHTISPAYAFEAAGGDQNRFFLTRDEIKERFAGLRDIAKRFPLLASPVYIDFLLGTRDLPCTPWANPTRNVAGWRAPCYLLMDGHYPTFREFMEKVPWDELGPGKDHRCQNCQVHAGFEPSAVLGRGTRLGDGLRLALWQLVSPRR
jgi:hopanoid biosynthesis associated radical SAM protein HpnH